MIQRLTLLLLSFAILAPVALAQSNRERPPGPPPPEAFEACESQEEGTQCAVETPRGLLEGICRRPPRLDALVCVPTGHRPPER
ncbi:MAG: hypothetical protein AAGF12_23635 [Myxococcota bacterium]